MYGLILNLCFCSMPPTPENQGIGNKTTTLLVNSIPNEPRMKCTLPSKQACGFYLGALALSAISFGVGYPIGHFYGSPSCLC